MNWMRALFSRGREANASPVISVHASQVIRADRIALGGLLGEGGFAKVYFCHLDGAPAVAKKVQIQKMDAETRYLLGNECEIWARVSHPNIVALHGVSSSMPPSDSLLLVCEYFADGSLFERHQALLRSRAPSPAPEEAADSLRQIVSGMAYLHGFDPPVLHRDLKSANILLAGARLAIGDFGLARYQTADRTMTAETGSYRWMAPEVVRHEPYDSACDVYSFGILAWEMLTYRLPFEECTPVQAALEVATGSRQPLLPDRYQGTPLGVLVAKCWHPRAAERPLFAQMML